MQETSRAHGRAHCHRGLGTLYAATGQREQAHTELTTAIEMYRDMEMTFWLPETEAALAQIEAHGVSGWPCLPRRVTSPVRRDNGRMTRRGIYPCCCPTCCVSQHAPTPCRRQGMVPAPTLCLGGHRQAVQCTRHGSVVDATRRESTIMADPHLRDPRRIQKAVTLSERPLRDLSLCQNLTILERDS